MIEVEGLSKHYGELAAVQHVSFRASAGRIFGLLGPNGAGKSTTIHCIAGLLKPSAGRVAVLGHDVVRDGRAARSHMGVVPQELALYDELSAAQNLAYFGGAYGLRGEALRARIDSVLALTGLMERSREPVSRFSGGMKRRLNFACGVVHEPKVLLLDEPTVGVDPQSRVRLLELVREERRRGTCILYTTHYMEEAEDLCDELAIIDHGKLIACGTLAELRAMLGERDLLRLSGSFDPQRVRPGLESVEELEIVVLDEQNLTLALEGASQRLPALFAALTRAGAEVRETTLSRASLESLFIKLTGADLRE